VSLTLLLLVAYSALMGVIGLWIGRRVRATGDFFVAGRTLGAGLIFATFLAGNIGAGSTVGAASLGYRDGLSAWWWNASAGIGCLVLAFSVGPRMWRESTRHGDLTVGDFLERRYGRDLRLAVAVLIWIGTLSILAGQLLGMSTVFQVVAGVSKLTGCILGAAIVCVYFIAGGLLSSAYVNLVQLAVKLVGFAMVTPMAMAVAGGWEAIALDSSRLDLLSGGSPQSGWRLLFFLGPAFVVSPGLLQKAFGARDERAVTKGVALNGMALIAFAVLPAILGMSARVLHPAIGSDLAFATIASDLPPAFGALALAAVFSAEASAADAVLFMLATSGSRDLYRRFRPAATDADLLRAARASSLVGATLGLALAMMHRSVIEALSAFYAVMVVTLFVPLIAGLYSRQTSRRQGLASLAGVPVLAAVHLSTDGSGYGVLTPVVSGVLASAAAFAVAGAGRRRGFLHT
jgi:solute:Na+ symporter, SSS family